VSKGDWLVLCALTLPRLEDQIELIRAECKKHPMLVLEPSVRWWTTYNAHDIVEYMKDRHG
jgi:hypothetical protein